MALRAPLHLLVLIGLLVALGGQTARSQPDQRPAPTVAAHQSQPAIARAIATSAIPSQSTIGMTAALTNTVYLPRLVLVAPPPVDLSIESLEITQAVQTPSNSVPLVAERPAIVRVYAKYTGTLVPGKVTLSLVGTRDGKALSPVTLGPQAVSAAPTRATYSSSFNLPLPTDWLSGTVAITATIDSGAAVDESNEINNTATATLKFNTVPALEIVIVPIRYTHTGTINPGVYPAPTQDTISDFIRRTYPLNIVNVTIRNTPLNFTGDLTYINANQEAPYWGNKQQTGLLDQVTALKGSELEFQGGIYSPKVYYGLVSTGTSVNNTWVPLNGSFVLGIGWISTRASVGLDIPDALGLPDDSTSDTAAHEIGHNLGRLHAPCKTTLGIDPNYPNKTASIVQFGVDISKGTVLNPSTTKDVMSYCEPRWVSDYTYKALYEVLSKKTTAATSAAPQASLFVRGGIGSDGTASLAPVYGVTGVPDATPSSSDYRVEFLDPAGNVVASQPVAVSEMEQPHLVALAQGQLIQQANALAVRGMDTRAPQLAINAIVATPAQAFSSMRLVRAGTVLATRRLSPAHATSAAIAPSADRQADDTLVLRWNAANGPALVRYTSDNGATWTTLGVDVQGGELSIDPAKLPAGTGYAEITSADSGAPTVRIAVP
ncbi:MAG: CARDB domain-containing protein [Roseiflexaceae bacterium]